MTTQQKKIAVISKVADTQDERLRDAVNQLLEKALPSELPEPG